jgi:hypothetical protein
MATLSELKAKLAILELSVDYVPAEFKDSILKKIEATKAEISTLEDEEEKDTEEKKTESLERKPVEKKVVKEQVKKTAKVSTKKNSVSEAKKQIKEVKKEVKVSPQAAKRGRPRKVVEVVVPKVAKKVVAKRKTKTQIKKAELKKAETKKVVAKKPVKKVVVRKTRSQLKVEKAMTALQRLVTKNKELKALYLNSGVDLEKDSTRSAKPFGWRLAGSNKRPTRQQIRNGDAYWEGRANRVDINNKAYPKLADGGMMAKGGGTDVKSRYAIVLKDKEGEEITQYTSANNLMDATKQAKLVADIYKMSLLKVYMVDDLEDSEKNRKQGIRMMKKKGMMDDGGMMARGGRTKDYSGNYYSTYEFVETNKLQKEADSLFGKNWEAEDDSNQILALVNSLGGGYNVKVADDKDDWENLRYKHDVNHTTNDSNYDIFVFHSGRKKK